MQSYKADRFIFRTLKQAFFFARNRLSPRQWNVPVVKDKQPRVLSRILTEYRAELMKTI